MISSRIVIIGATSAIAECCARIWVQRSNTELVLVGRDITRLNRVASDLSVRNPNSKITCQTVDFVDPVEISKFVKNIFSNGNIDLALIAQGTLPDQKECQNNLSISEEALTINGISPVLFAEAFSAQMEKVGAGKIVIIGSVAGDRGRKSNYTYGAAKALVSRYAEGLQHRFAETNVKIILIKPGPTDTPMTADLKQNGARLADVNEVATQIINAIDHGKREVYTPKKWRIIMLVIRHIPMFIFKKLNI